MNIGKRRHFIITVPNENVIHSLNVCIGLNTTQRYSLDKGKLYVKTTQPLIQDEEAKGVKLNKIFPPGLSTEYEYNDIVNILKTEEWQEQDNLPTL